MADERTTNAVAAEILPIDKASIHRICSGHGILDLAGAVKELVENSLDSGANRIDIRLTEFGTDLIEVADNGPGVSPEYYQALTLKYCTSKIRTDLHHLSSFGYRGEALSSLCALANVAITTRTAEEAAATRLEFDHSGVIVSQTFGARCVGTTVSVANLFSPLPVRLDDFRRNVRREYARLVRVLQARALISKGVRLLCTNQTGGAGRNTVIQTPGSLSIRENIKGVFGSSTLRLLESIDVRVLETCRVEGFLSKPTKGTGHASSDRQFFYINGRPVNLPKVAKSLNELYRSFNPNQFPIVIINFILRTSAYDINMSPDKRQVCVYAERDVTKAFIAALRKEYAHFIGDNTQKTGKPTLSQYLVPVGHASLKSGPEVRGRDTCRDLGKVDGYVRREEDYLIVTKSDKAEHGNRQADIPDRVQSTLNPFLRTCGDIEQDGDVQKEEFFVSAASDMAEQDDTPDSVTLKLKPFRPLLMIKSFRTKPRSAILSTASRSAELSRFAPSEMRQHGTVQLRLPSRFKRQLEQSREWPPLKKCTVVDTSAMDQKGSKASNPSTECTDINEEQGQQRPEPKNLRQGSVSDWFVGLKESSESKAHQGALSSKSESSVPETEGLRSNVEGVEAKPLEFSSAPQVEVPGDQPYLPGIQQVNHEVAEDSSASSLETEDLGELDHLESGKQELTPLVTGSEALTETGRLVSVLPLNRLPARGLQEAEHPTKEASVIKFDMKRMQTLSKRRLLRGEDKITDPRTRRSFTFATVGDLSIGGKIADKQVAVQAATKELGQNLKKADFKRMEVLGQFDLHFILAKLDEDIFILDQHASDEIYNFQHLMRTAVVNSQLLPRPLPLELEASDELTVVTHMKTFRQNGFVFLEDREAAVGQQLHLSAIPSYTNGELGLEDIRELISLLAKRSSRGCKCNCEQQPKCSCQLGWLPRPSRYTAMFASEACKMSKRVGDALGKKEMEEVVSRMAELEAPWTCVHGRPTIQHMVDLGSILSL